MAQLARLDDAIMVMQASLQRDLPDTRVEQPEYCEEVVRDYDYDAKADESLFLNLFFCMCMDVFVFISCR